MGYGILDIGGQTRQQGLAGLRVLVELDLAEPAVHRPACHCDSSGYAR